MTSEKRPKGPRITIVPCSRAQANAFVGRFHRHHKPVVSGFFSLAAVDETGLVRGVAMVGRPMARPLCDGWSAEVNRLATDGCPNACSALYGASWRVCRQMGYRRLFTYILDIEPGTSLRATGWKLDGHVDGRSWDTPARRRTEESHPLNDKQRWVIEAKDEPLVTEVRWPEEMAEEQDDGPSILEYFT